MSERLLLGFAFLLLVAGCRQEPEPPETALPATTAPTAVVEAPASPTVPAPTALAPPPTETPLPGPRPTALPTAPPTPTSLAEGWSVGVPIPESLGCPNPYPWFFANPARECADTLLNTWAVMQRFEHGLMVWFAEGGRTYVLLDDGSPFKPYVEVFDTTGLPWPGPDADILPPPGLHQPVRGFANHWRGLVPGSEWVRDALGWAVAPEAPYSAFWQCNTATGDAARCYFTGPRDEILVLARGSAAYWNNWQGPVR